MGSRLLLPSGFSTSSLGCHWRAGGVGPHPPPVQARGPHPSPGSDGESVSVTTRIRSLASPRWLAKVGRARLPGRKNFSPAREIALIAATEEIYNLLRSDT